jgi:hypothetical protein
MPEPRTDPRRRAAEQEAQKARIPPTAEQPPRLSESPPGAAVLRRWINIARSRQHHRYSRSPRTSSTRLAWLAAQGCRAGGASELNEQALLAVARGVLDAGRLKMFEPITGELISTGGWRTFRASPTAFDRDLARLPSVGSQGMIASRVLASVLPDLPAVGGSAGVAHPLVSVERHRTLDAASRSRRAAQSHSDTTPGLGGSSGARRARPEAAADAAQASVGHAGHDPTLASSPDRQEVDLSASRRASAPRRHRRLVDRASGPGEPRGVDQQRGEPLHPAVDRDVIDRDTALSRQLLDVAIGPTAQIPPHRHHDHIRREPEPRGARPWCWHTSRTTTHQPTLPE